MFKVTRVSKLPAQPMRIFFNAIGRSLEFNAANAAHGAGSPQDVSDEVAEAITSDAGLAPHFRCEPYESSADASATGPAADAVADETADAVVPAHKAKRIGK
jgi:hypothetical protein